MKSPETSLTNLLFGTRLQIAAYPPGFPCPIKEALTLHPPDSLLVLLTRVDGLCRRVLFPPLPPTGHKICV